MLKVVKHMFSTNLRKSSYIFILSKQFYFPCPNLSQEVILNYLAGKKTRIVAFVSPVL